MSLGDAVVVKGLPNSPIMTVVRIGEYENPSVLCGWFIGARGNEVMHQVEFAIECLEPAEGRLKDEKNMRSLLDSIVQSARIELMTNDDLESES